MGFTKFTVSEQVEAHREKEQEKIHSFVKEAGVKSVEDLTEEQKEDLQKSLAS